MSTRRGWVHPEVYREARRAGYRPALAAYVGRPPVVELESGPDAGCWDAGTFDYRGETFTYRIEWDDNCICSESDLMEGEDLSDYEHRFVVVSLGDRDASLGGVCGNQAQARYDRSLLAVSGGDLDKQVATVRELVAAVTA